MPLTLLDFGELNPFGETIGKPRGLAWPVNLYRVTLPKGSENSERLNAFERVILKLIDAGVAPEAEILALETCLPKDLVQCVLLHLRDKKYIDEYSQIIKKQRGKWANEDYNQEEFVTACLFRELATGKVLPYLHILEGGNRLKKKEMSIRKIHWVESHKTSQVTTHDVISALRVMQKRSKAFGIETSLPSVKLITIADVPELHYLYSPIAIQKSDLDFRIADPFGNGFSLVLETAFSRLLEEKSDLCEWLMNWKRSLSNLRTDNSPKAQCEFYDNNDNRARYPKLVANLELRKEQYRSIEKIYAAIEWALFYSCAQRPYASAVQQLKLTSQSEHHALLQKAAEDVSLKLSPYGLRPIMGGKLDGFLSGKADLETVLSLSLLMAANDVAHPLRSVATKHPDFILRLFKIKKDRDELGHGSGKVRLKDVELLEEGFMREVVTILLPTIRFADSVVTTVGGEAIMDSLLDARTSIQGEFGFALFNRLGANQQNYLIDAELFWLSCNDGDDAIAFAFDLYAVLQSAFRQSLSGVLPPDVEDSEYTAAAQQNARKSGLGELPECLITAKRSAIRETLQGNDQTLQSCVVAYLLVSDAEILRAIAQTYPSFVTDVALVIDRRGHGNEFLPLPKDEIRKLRKAAYTIIKTLLEA